MKSGLAGALLAVALVAFATSAQETAIPRDQLLEVMPGADRFGVRSGDPPVVRAYRTDGDHEVLVGFVFLTQDVPPERFGYSGPIQMLAGLDLLGRITGMRVWDYRESHRSTRGDFLRVPGFQEQFADKPITDPFVIRQDVDGISRATISVQAAARGVRDAARRVAEAYLDVTEPVDDVADNPEALEWFDLIRSGVVARMEVSNGRRTIDIALAHVMNEAFGERFVGPSAMGMVHRALERREGGRHIFVYAVDGPPLQFFNRTGWSVVQGEDTVAVQEFDVFSFGLASGGMLDVEVGTGGGMLVDRAIDLERPFTFVFSLDSAIAPFTVEYQTQDARRAQLNTAVIASGVPLLPPSGESRGSPPLSPPVPSAPGAAAPPDEVAAPAVPAQTAQTPPTAEPLQAAQLQPTVLAAPTTAPGPPAQTDLQQTLASTSWLRVGATAALLVLVSLAFALKHTRLGWFTLSVTLVFLGFVDGGFLSVSHITSAIWVGPSAVFGDLALLLMIVFTIVTTLLFGRVFCGFLCPFGALQDFLARLLPSRLKVRVPARVHRPGLYAKYVILAVILIPALLGSRESWYQYFEPFGTVFFQSSSLLLWTIALGFLAASLLIPRFYCRYACPLGAALAVASLIAWKRIRRVEHCDHCKVCENQCPTGAIAGPTIDFKECVRCNICEVKLNERAGVCRHDLGEVRSRLVQLHRAPGRGPAAAVRNVS